MDKRFNDFVELDRGLNAIFDREFLSLPSLPKKTFWKRVDDAFIKTRQFHLQQYLNAIQSKSYLRHSKIYRDFLQMDKFFSESIPISPFLRFVQNVIDCNFCFVFCKFSVILAQGKKNTTKKNTTKKNTTKLNKMHKI